MADGLHTPQHVRCLSCVAREHAIPAEAQLRILASEDWAADIGAFEPRAMTQQQAVASEMLTTALHRFAGVYGVDVAAPRIAAMLQVLRLEAKRLKIMGRILAAREGINQRARRAWERGDTDAMRAIEAEPTPDYPGKASDDAWLKQDMEAQG